MLQDLPRLWQSQDMLHDDLNRKLNLCDLHASSGSSDGTCLVVLLMPFQYSREI